MVSKSPAEALDRLKLAMSGGNFEIIRVTDDTISFKHGTFLTQSAPQFPKHGTIRVAPADGGSEITYDVEPALFVRCWLIFFAVVFFWLIFPPIIAYRTLVYHPRRLMENLLSGL
jgi:hypothetical protein